MKNIAINGLGRIGRLTLRHYITYPSKDVRIVAANDLTTTEDLAYLLKYDYVHGTAAFDIHAEGDILRADGQAITILHEPDPARLPWKQLGVDTVLECTGRFRHRQEASKHLAAGASKVIISAPSDNADITIIQGVNQQDYDPSKHHIISNASCTTNSLAPAVKVLQDTFGVKHLLVTTVHAYTASQSLIDKATRKRRRGRAAGLNLVPTSTGAAKATGLVLPDLKEHMDAMAIRAPVADGAITDIVAELETDVTVEQVNGAFLLAAGGPMRGILQYSDDDFVSSDIIGNLHSGIIDAGSTIVVDRRMVKVLVWYDNEAGYAKKLLELAEFIARRDGTIQREQTVEMMRAS
jgi:glyceraldehyde-3-phosphate dehydrogenase type I